MTDRLFGRSRPGGSEVSELVRDLEGLVIEERCSFGPELRAELVREHRRLVRGRSSSARRSDAARWLRPARRGRFWTVAAAAFLLLAGGALATPRARGAVMGVFGFGDGAGTPAPSSPAPAGAASAAASARQPAAAAFFAAPAAVGLGEPPAEPSRMPATLPVLADRDAARRAIASEYPAVLEESGVGGTVRLLMWVGPDGATEFPRVDGSSGRRELDSAALRASRSLRFVPATRLGEAVGTWVSFSVVFEPG